MYQDGFYWNKKRDRSLFLWFLHTSMEVYRKIIGAGNETRTRDPDLGKVVLYQLSYSRVLVWRIL